MANIFHTLLHYLALPASMFNQAFGLPDTLAFSRFLLANLFAVSILTVSCWSFLVWKRSRYYYYLALYFVLVITAMVGYQATLIAKYAWIYSLMAVIISFFFVFFSQISRRFPPFTRKVLRRFYVFGAIIALCLPLVFSWRYQSNKQNIENQSLNDISQIEKNLQQKQSDLSRVADKLADDKDIKQTITQTAQQSIVLNQLAIDNKVGFIAFTDPLANLTARSNYKITESVNYFERTSWGYNLFFLKEPVDSLAQDVTQIPALISGRPIYSENRSLLGFILVGQPLDNTYINTLYLSGNLGLLTEKGTVFSKTSDKDIALMVNLADFNQENAKTFSQYGTTPQTVGSSIIQFKGKHYLITGRQQNNLETDKLYYLFSIKENREFTVFSLLDVLGVVALSFILVMIMSFTKRFFLKLWSFSGRKTTAKETTDQTNSNIDRPVTDSTQDNTPNITAPTTPTDDSITKTNFS